MEHIALMAQEQIEMEFKEELMQLQQLQMITQLSVKAELALALAYHPCPPVSA